MARRRTMLPSISWRMSGSRQRGVDLPHEFEVERRQATGVMRRDGDVDAVVDVGPVRMMIEALGDERHLRHETECLHERVEDQQAAQRGAVELPSVERCN